MTQNFVIFIKQYFELNKIKILPINRREFYACIIKEDR